MKKYSWLFFLISCLTLFYGCVSSNYGQGNTGKMPTYVIPSKEASWIRNGEPIEFEGELWYPYDGTEVLQDTEVILAGEYRGVQFFVDRIDVRPYNRLYTKFDRNVFRFFEKKKQP